MIEPKEQAVAYGFTNVFAPREHNTQLLIGSDDYRHTLALDLGSASE